MNKIKINVWRFFRLPLQLKRQSVSYTLQQPLQLLLAKAGRNQLLPD